MINSFQNYWQWRKEHSKRTKGYLSIILMLTLKEKANARMQNSNTLCPREIVPRGGPLFRW